jgi:hypothetical protein
MLGCHHIVHSGHSGYCDCGRDGPDRESESRKVHVNCNHATFVCSERCRLERDADSERSREDRADNQKWEEEQWKEWVHRDHQHSPSDGCRVQGSINSLNVPGSLRFEIYSAWHDIPHEKLNLSHTVHHFSFGKTALAMMELLEKEALDDVWMLDGVNNINGMSRKYFPSKLPRGGHEHFFRVVRTEIDMKKKKDAAENAPHHYYQYQYFSHESNEKKAGRGHQEHRRHATGTPHVRFTWTLDPLAIAVTQITPPFVELFVALCAILGGVYTCFGLIDGLTHSTVRRVREKLRQGKQF